MAVTSFAKSTTQHMYELLTPTQMDFADRLTIECGTHGIELMECAGQAIAKVLDEHFPDAQNILMVCGTGNNGGDGFVAARHLSKEGRNSRVFISGDITKISGDAELALARLDRSMLLHECPDFAEFDLIVDALFGAGLDREVRGEFANTITKMNESGKPILSVDLPSGIDGRTGQIMGCAIHARRTVTFFRKKPGHILLPGRQHCGECSLYQIGIDDTILEQTSFAGLQNHPDCWRKQYPLPGFDGHKYDRGHTLVLSGPAIATGAARLMAHAALRVGSGLVTIASPTEALATNAAHLTSVMLQKADNPKDIQHILSDKRFNCVALGPGLPPGKHTIKMVLKVLELQRITVLDAGALVAFSKKSDLLFAAIKSSDSGVFLTPHEGEFNRLFPDESALPSKLDRAKSAAEKSGATIILKGPDTVVATPEGCLSISDNAPPWLATAGTGDVLAGIVAGLVAQGMPAFEAASAAVWLHGDAANRLGPGITSADIDDGLRQAIRHFVLLNSSNLRIKQSSTP